jgi:hypothetical protein
VKWRDAAGGRHWALPPDAELARLVGGGDGSGDAPPPPGRGLARDEAGLEYYHHAATGEASSEWPAEGGGGLRLEAEGAEEVGQEAADASAPTAIKGHHTAMAASQLNST